MYSIICISQSTVTSDVWKNTTLGVGSPVLKIVVGHIGHFPTKINIRLNIFGFGQTKYPNRNFVLEATHPLTYCRNHQSSTSFNTWTY